MSLNPKNLKEENKMLYSPATWVPILYFAMGISFVVLNVVCTLMYKGMGVSDKQVAFWTSLIILPWTLKSLWSPFLEIYKTKKFSVILTQLLTGVLFALAAFALHLPFFFPITIAIFVVIVLGGATHDIATGGTYMSVLSNEEQARWIGWQGALYSIVRIAAIGGLVYLAGTFIEHFDVTKTQMFIMLTIATIMLVIGCYHIIILPNPKKTTTDSPKTLKESLGESAGVFIDFFKKKHIVYYIFFIILYRSAEGLVMKIVPLLLRASRADQGLGLSEQEIGLCYGTSGAAALVTGSILVDYYVAWRGLQKSLFSLALVFNIPFIAYTFLATYQPESLWLIGDAIVMEYFDYDSGFVGLSLFMTQQIAPGRHQMAYYAFASGIMNLGVMSPGMLSGVFSDFLGCRQFFIFALVCTIPALLVTWFVSFTYTDDTKTEKLEA